MRNAAKLAIENEAFLDKQSFPRDPPEAWLPPFHDLQVFPNDEFVRVAHRLHLACHARWLPYLLPSASPFVSQNSSPETPSQTGQIKYPIY